MTTTVGLARGARLPDTLLDALAWPSGHTMAAVLLFVRGPWCPVCRRQLARFAARADELQALGVPIYVISSGEATAFADDDRLSRLPLRYINDPGGAQLRALGIAADHPDYGTIARPATAVIDPAGVVQFAHIGAHSRDRPEPAAVLLAVRRLLGMG